MHERLVLKHHSFRSRSLFFFIFHFHHDVIHSLYGYIVRIVMVALHTEVTEVFSEVAQMDVITDIGSHRLVFVFKPSGQLDVCGCRRSILKLVMSLVVVCVLGMEIIGSGFFYILVIELHYLVALFVVVDGHTELHLPYVLRQVHGKRK